MPAAALFAAAPSLSAGLPGQREPIFFYIVA